MYNIIIYLYQLGVIITSLFNEKVRKMWQGERDAIRVLRQQIDPDARYVWFHAASLGEFEQGRPLMEELRRQHPEYKILLTFFSPSGYEVRKNYQGADIICYLPLDTITNARRFLRTIRPVMAFFIKYEFWYNYLHILKHRGIPVYSVSSIFRPGQVFFRWYGRQYAHVLKCFTRFYVQNDISKQLLATIGIHDVTIVGDTRFDRVLQIKDAARQLPLIEQFLEVGGQLSFIFHHIVQIQQSVSVIHRHVRPPRGLVYLYDIDIAVAHGGTDEGDEFRARQVYFEGGELYAHRWPERSDKHGVGVLVLDGGSIVQTLQGASLIGRRLRRMGTNRHMFEHRRLQVATLCFP